MTDRQTTGHTMEKLVGIGKITCSRAISPKNESVGYILLLIVKVYCY